MRAAPAITRGARAVITGAGSGIGRALALELAARGGEMVCSDLNVVAAEETAQLCRSRGATAHSVRCDVTVLEDVEELAHFAQTRLAGPVSLLINNAGIGAGGQPVGELGIEQWRRGIAVNLWGPIHGCEVFVPILRTAATAGIINIASAAAFGAVPLMGPYCVSKSGVLSLSEVLAAELAGSAITVSVVCPTLVKTNIVANAVISEGPARVAQKLMESVGTTPERIARTILDGHDRRRLYITPQLDAKLAWSAKRHVPSLYLQGMKLFGRIVKGKVADRRPSPQNSDDGTGHGRPPCNREKRYSP